MPAPWNTENSISANEQIQTFSFVVYAFMARFKSGDKVRWITPRGERPVIGTIETPIACDSDQEEFTMYEVRFAFGELTLYGSQLEPSDGDAPRLKDRT